MLPWYATWLPRPLKGMLGTTSAPWSPASITAPVWPLLYWELGGVMVQVPSAPVVQEGPLLASLLVPWGNASA